MAKSKSKELEDGLTDGLPGDKGKKYKTYKNEGFVDFAEGQEIEGTLISIRDHSMMDRRKKILKDVRVYNIRLEYDDSLIRLAGRTMLDRMADDIMDENGGFEVENRRYSGKGYEWFINRSVKFIRGEDTQTNEGNQLGMYEILVEDDS